MFLFSMFIVYMTC